MSDRKQQFWLRPDQRECVLTCLRFSISQFDGQVANSPVQHHAIRLARPRVCDAINVFDPPPAKAKP